MDDQNIVTVQVTTSAIIAYGIEIVKRCKWFPWINQETEKLNRAIAALAALIAALGIHARFDSATGYAYDHWAHESRASRISALTGRHAMFSKSLSIGEF